MSRKNGNNSVGKKVGAMVMASLLAVGTMSACSGGGGSSKLQFWVYGDEKELVTFTKMTDTFNKTYGASHNIEVEISAKPVGDSYNNLIRTTGTASSGADIFFVSENEFKKFVEMGFMQEMDEYFAAVDDIDVSDISDSMLLKYKYDIDTKTMSKDSDPLYGLPIDVRPTALYYNEDVFTKAGIIVISVDEEDMDKWNAGEIADRRGKYKSDYEKLNGLTVPKKGFYREEPCVDYGTWNNPVTQGEIMVFNNRIAMNWNEVEDLARLFTNSATCNPNAAKQYGTDYGYFTEWWFNYGWSVGGDCLADLTGEGYWNYSLLDPNPNYMVNVDGYVGEFTGDTYKKGDTLSLTDKLAVNKGELLVADDKGGYTLNGQTVGVRESVKNSGDFTELPSTREAFERYLRLGTNIDVTDANGETIKGISVSPSPSVFSASSRTSVNYFCDGKIAMLVQESAYVQTIGSTAKFKWDIAPILQYKDYEDNADGSCDTVVASGKLAGHSNSRGMMTRKKAAEKNGDSIARFIMWMASEEGQKIRAEEGAFPNQESLVPNIKYSQNAPGNMDIFVEAMQYQRAGDWWYLKGYSWIDVWAVPLNTVLRNSKSGYTYEQWIKETLKDSNDMLKNDYIG